MKMKFGAIVVDGRGKIGGHVASKNRSSAYLRTKVTPVNPRTASQLGVRSLFTSLSQGWRSLTQAQRDAWNAAVVNFAKTNIFGDLRNPSGFNLYQKLNNNLSQIGEAILTNPPLPSEVVDIVIGTLTVAVAVPALSLAYSPGASADSTIIVKATPPMSAGKSFVKSEFRQIGSFAANAASPFNALAAYTDIFGSTGAIGQKIFIETVAVNTTTGQTGTPQQTFAVSVA